MKNHAAIIAVVWLTISFLSPATVKHLSSNRAEGIKSGFHYKTKKVKIVNNFESRAKREAGIFKKENIEKAKVIIEKFWNDDYKKINAVDSELTLKIRETTEFSNMISLLFPSSFYMATGNEASSYGHENFLKLRHFLMELRTKFVRFWIDRVYYNDPKEIIDFLEVSEEDINVFEAEPKLPPYFWIGVSIGVFWGAFFLAIAYFPHLRALFPPHAAKEANCDDVDIDFISGGTYGLIVRRDPEFATILLNLFFGRPGKFNGKVAVNGESIVNGNQENFLYLPNPVRLDIEESAGVYMSGLLRYAGVCAGDIDKYRSQFSKKILETPYNKLEPLNKLRLFMAFALSVDRKIYIFYNWSENLYGEDRNAFAPAIGELADAGKIVFDLVDNVEFQCAASDKLKNLGVDPQSGKYLPLKI